MVLAPPSHSHLFAAFRQTECQHIYLVLSGLQSQRFIFHRACVKKNKDKGAFLPPETTEGIKENEIIQG